MSDLGLLIGGVILCYLFLLVMHLWIDGDVPRCALRRHRWVSARTTELTSWGFVTAERCTRCGKRRTRKGL